MLFTKKKIRALKIIHISSISSGKSESDGLKCHFTLNFIIHFIVAAKLFAINNFDVAHVVGLGVVLLILMHRGAAYG